MQPLTEQQAMLATLWARCGEDHERWGECAERAGYAGGRGSRQLKSRMLNDPRFRHAVERVFQGLPAVENRADNEIKQNVNGAYNEGIKSQLDALKANKTPDSEWVLSEALRLYTLALAEEKLPLAKSLLEIIAKHRKVDAFASTSNTTVNVFTDKAETLLIQGRKRLQSMPAAQDESTPPPPRNRAMPPPEGNPPFPVPAKNDVSHQESPLGLANSEKKIQSESGVTDGEWEEVI